jgi:uncharacterized protein YlxP (DUF503 family)
MYVFAAQFLLHLPSRTLKEKRGIIRSILARSRNSFNVAAAEVDHQNMTGSSIIAFVTVSEDRTYAQGLLERLEKQVVDERPDIEVVAVEIEER